jgi:hypothetical protein
MKDVTLNEIVQELQDEFPSKVPKFIIRKIVEGALRTIYHYIDKPGYEFRFHYCDLVKIYEVINGKEVIGRAIDLDETQIKRKSELVPIVRVPYYNILVHNTKSGEKKKKIIGFKGYNRRKSI